MRQDNIIPAVAGVAIIGSLIWGAVSYSLPGTLVLAGIVAYCAFSRN